MVGVLGVLLPIALLLGDAYVLSDLGRPRASLSAYYHSGMRDFYVGILLATGIVLITYKVADRSLNNYASTLAGLAVTVVAFAPTGLPPGCSPAEGLPANGCPPLTGMQERFGEGLLSGMHATASFIFIALMLLLAVIFGIQEGGRESRRIAPSQKHPPEFWQAFHWTCASIIAAVLLLNWGTEQLDIWRGSFLTFTETICALAFGISWCAKGLERPYL